MTSFHHYVPTALDNELETPPNQSGSSQRRVRDPNIDPALYTPSKRMRFMTHALSTTTSGSFLISNEPITSSHPIPEPVLEGPPMLAAPNWDLARADEDFSTMTRAQLVSFAECARENLGIARQHIGARDSMIEANHATMVVQSLFLKKQATVLNAKENKKKDDRTVLSMEGKGHHLTADEWIEASEAALADRTTKAAEKETKKARRADAKVRREAFEVKWKDLMEKHTEEVEKWKERCAELHTAGTRVKDLPGRPKKLTKKQFAVQEKVGEDSESSGDEGDGE
ncbi:hypothetical protein C8J56DRAFT_786147 [Mycena floridula]|nr:hypothetical protein C8J56DRAFT_786147 [Mycena floridula]